MTKDVLGNTNRCEVCGKLIRGSGIYYCAKHRTQRQRDNSYKRHGPPTFHIPSDQQRELNKVLGFLFIGLFIIMILVLMLYLITEAISGIWNSGIIGKVVLLTPFIIVGLYVFYKLWNLKKPKRYEWENKERIIKLVAAYFIIVGIIVLYLWASGIYSNYSQKQIELAISKKSTSPGPTSLPTPTPTPNITGIIKIVECPEGIIPERLIFENMLAKWSDGTPLYTSKFSTSWPLDCNHRPSENPNYIYCNLGYFNGAIPRTLYIDLITDDNDRNAEGYKVISSLCKTA
jgi:hypothetical protein